LLWLDPGEAATREHSLRVIMDVVDRYDIDGVHFDDYFYPYPEKVNGQDVEFPDELSWQAYRRRGGKLLRNDWRRANVDSLIHSVYDSIKAAKPWVKFGISPFGIWRPHNPSQITGLDAYDSLFADSRRWLAEGWVDYLAPQLYWPIEQKAQGFDALLQWWSGQNARQRHLWPGMKVNGWATLRSDPAEEMIREIEHVRHRPGASGEGLWHAAALSRNPRLADALENRVYSAPALVPASPWLSANDPAIPVVRTSTLHGKLTIEWSAATNEVWQWLLREKIGDHWRTEILPRERTSRSYEEKPKPSIFTVCAVNRFGKLSAAAVFRP